MGFWILLGLFAAGILALPVAAVRYALKAYARPIEKIYVMAGAGTAALSLFIYPLTDSPPTPFLFAIPLVCLLSAANLLIFGLSVCAARTVKRLPLRTLVFPLFLSTLPFVLIVLMAMLR